MDDLRLSTEPERPPRKNVGAATLNGIDITTREGQITHLAVTHEVRREHDGSVISAHCCLDCAYLAHGKLSLAAMMGDNPPGPLEWVRA